jgi:CelD/BcsL family acetyltransferase involved in cellulose biosynthesis
MKSDIVTNVIRTRKEAFDLEEEFSDFYAALPCPNVYFSPEWVYTWLATLGRRHEIFFVTAMADGHLVGVWPFFEYPLPAFGKALLPAASQAADLFDPVATPEAREPLVLALMGALGEFNFAWLPLLTRNFAEEILEPVMNAQRNPHLLRQRTPRFLVDLDRFEDFTSYTATVFGPKTRQNLRRKARRLSDDGEVEMRTLHTPKEIALWIPKMVELEKGSWKWQERAGIFQLAEMRGFYQILLENLAKSRRVRVCILTVNGRLVAHEIGFLGMDSYCMHSTVFDPEFAANSPGRLLMLFSIQKCIEERRRIYDFLQNDAEFKRQMATSESRLWDWIILPNSLRGRLWKQVIRAVQLWRDWRYNPTRREGSLEREMMASSATENAKE